MKIVVVGMMTYCVENRTAAEILGLAAEAINAGDFEGAAEYKKTAARVESGAMSAEEWHARHAVPPVLPVHTAPPRLHV